MCEVGYQKEVQLEENRRLIIIVLYITGIKNFLTMPKRNIVVVAAEDVCFCVQTYAINGIA